MIRLRSNSASEARIEIISLPWAVSVLAQASAKDLKVAPASPICARTLSRSRVDLASLSSRVTTKVSPGPRGLQRTHQRRSICLGATDLLAEYLLTPGSM